MEQASYQGHAPRRDTRTAAASTIHQAVKTKKPAEAGIRGRGGRPSRNARVPEHLLAAADRESAAHSATSVSPATRTRWPTCTLGVL
jgi:hypothetical protein